MSDSVVTTRYGVFLVPDPVTCLAVTTITGAIRAQYGFVSAGAFPVHATLAGSLPIAVPESQLVEVLTALLDERGEFPVQNAGVAVLDSAAVVYDVGELDGRINGPLRELAADIGRAVLPLLAPTRGLAADLPSDGFRGHLSLASHELGERPDLLEEVAAFATALPMPCPNRFVGDTVALYRFSEAAWADGWWRTMTWEHVRTWHLRP